MNFSILYSTITLLLFLVCSPVQGAGDSTSPASAIALIRNKLSLFDIIQDTKDFQALNKVFTPDATPDGLAGPNNTYAKNLTGIETFLKFALDDATTLHFSDTQYIEVGPTGDTASVTSYGQAVYFAKDVNVTGQICTFYEQIFDDFVFVGDQWLSQNKTLLITVRILSSYLNRDMILPLYGSCCP